MRSYINELFSRIEKDTKLKNSVKIIGIAVGNNKDDVAFEEKKYNFPIVPDDKYVFHQLVGQPPTPFFIFAQPYGKGRLFVLDSYLGRLEDTDKLFAMVNVAIKKSISGTPVALKKQQDDKLPDDLVLPVKDSELNRMISQSLVVNGEKPDKIEKIKLTGLGEVYTGVLKTSKKRIFARVVARKIPCIDCHDVFFIYSFDDAGKFMQFIPISITKLDNEKWDEKDINKMQNNFKEISLLEKRRFNPAVDAISSATISSEIIFHSMGETELVLGELLNMGYIKR